jgi:predicted PurR-regulated permease PerM
MALGSTIVDSRKRIGEVALILVTCIGLYLCWLLARPFLPAISWALALAVVGYPLHRQTERVLQPSLAALLSVVAIAIILLVPGFSLCRLVFSEAADSLKTLAENMDSARLHQAAGKYSATQELLQWLETTFDFEQEFKRAAGALASQVPAALSGSIRFVTQFAIMLVMLFYSFRDRARLLQYAGRLVPLSASETNELFRRISETLRAAFLGNLMVKLVQGLLGGLMFWILGLPNPALAGAAMALFAMLPIVGTSVVWGPAALFLLLQGSWIKALILLVWGALVVILVDNIVYPILVATELRLHTLGIFVAVFGGLMAFGIAGIVLGPVILAATVAMLEVWRLRANPESIANPESFKVAP